MKCIKQIDHCVSYDAVSSKCLKCADDYQLENSDCKENTLGTGAIIGIVVGVIAAVVITGVLIWYFMVHRKKEIPYKSSNIS